MSRTYKEIRRRKDLTEYWKQDRVPVVGFGGWRLTKTTKPKRRKTVDTEDHWMTTPGWWIRLKMNGPQRKLANKQTRLAVNTDVEEVDIADCGRKPHIYFW